MRAMSPILLVSPVNDARALASSLNELEFDVTLLEDADRTGLDQLVGKIRASFPKDGIAVFYYSGHALQYRGRNYLLPTDFKAAKAADLPKSARCA